MHIKRLLSLACGLLVLGPMLLPQDDMKIECWTMPASVMQGDEGLLRIKITMRPGTKISSHPEFIIRFAESEQFSFSKIFFTGSELNFPRVQEGGGIFLDLQKEIEIPFRVSADAFIGKHAIKGEIVFTILSQDNWYIKTLQKFTATFNTKKNAKLNKKGVSARKKNGPPLAGSFRASPGPGTTGWSRPLLLPDRNAG